jgi:LysM repeat protein
MKTKKFKLPNLFILRSKKLRATTAHRPLRIAAAANYDDIGEPNMKLSRALLIVLLLHVVAVAGIIAFNAIKTRQGSFGSGAAAANLPAATKPVSSVSTLPATAKETGTRDETKSSRTTKSGANDAKSPPFSSKTYVVAKGDNPVTIAKKFKVPYDDLLALNHIDDPRKLKIGQKLLIPNKPAKGKKDE